MNGSDFDRYNGPQDQPPTPLPVPHHPHRPPQPTGHASPSCWQCGYSLCGLRVDDTCPECGTPIYSVPPPPPVHSDAQAALVWGIVALSLFFVCIGPLAGFVAIPAITKGGRIMKQVQAGRIPPSSGKGGKAGFVLGWITASLSIGSVLFYAVILFIALL